MARQQIIPGASLEIATPDEVASLLGPLIDHRKTHHHREKGSITPLDGTGAGTASIKIQGQYDWILERITISTGANATVSLYENQVQASDLLEVIGLGSLGLYSDGFDNNLWVPALSTLLVVCSGGGAGGTCAFNLQVRLEGK